MRTISQTLSLIHISQYGIFEYLMEQKKNGRIRHLGFSCHGNLPVLKRFLEAYGSHMAVS